MLKPQLSLEPQRKPLARQHGPSERRHARWRPGRATMSRLVPEVF